MSDWFDSVRASLDRARGPVTVFFRDDDAGWADERLFALIDTCAAHGAPLDLAVIPQCLTQSLADELTARSQADGARLGMHQHGFAHENHETTGRKCEFGPTRSQAQQMEDLARGKRRLEELLGPLMDPIFTPPWNRCTQATVDCLDQLGFRALSRDTTAQAMNLGDLQEIRVGVDWCRWRPAADGTWADLGQRIAAAAEDGGQVGIMLHHAVMDEKDLGALAGLLASLAGHHNVEFQLMREIAGLAAGREPLQRTSVGEWNR